MNSAKNILKDEVRRVLSTAATWLRFIKFNSLDLKAFFNLKCPRKFSLDLVLYLLRILLHIVI